MSAVESVSAAMLIVSIDAAPLTLSRMPPWVAV
ncbi:hypothetical protein ACVWZ3_006737 [Bradyrhizobium sp. i1.3.6]